MPVYRYLIIGGGMTADAAIKGIRQIDSSGSIGVIGREKHKPYKRPPLSKALWKGEPLESVWLQTEPRNVTFHLAKTAIGIEPTKKRVVDDGGETYSYEKLLLATGGKVRPPSTCRAA